MTVNKLEGKARDVHSCSYYCERPDCVKAQRDELREAYVVRGREYPNEAARQSEVSPAPIAGCDTRHAVTFYFNDKAAADQFRARQSEGMVPHVWVLERVRDGAIRAVQREAPDDFDMTVAEDENNRYVRYVAAAPADAGEGES